MKQLQILAVSLSVNFRGSNEICVSQSCQDLNQQWTQTPASEIYISWQMRGRVCAPGCALVHPSSPVWPSGRYWETWKAAEAKCEAQELCLAHSGAAELCWEGARYPHLHRAHLIFLWWLDFTLLHGLPYTRDQFLLPEAGHGPCLCGHASL